MAKPLAGQSVIYEPSEPSGFKWVDKPSLSEDGFILSTYLRGNTVYVQSDEPTDMEENDIWIKI